MCKVGKRASVRVLGAHQAVLLHLRPASNIHDREFMTCAIKAAKLMNVRTVLMHAATRGLSSPRRAQLAVFGATTHEAPEKCKCREVITNLCSQRCVGELQADDIQHFLA